MSVSKITSAPSENELVNKVNEVIDNLGGGGGTTYTAGDGIIIENDEISVDGVSTNEIDVETTTEVTLATVATTGAFSDLSGTSGVQMTSNLVRSISSSSTDTQYPSAKCVYDIVGDIETLINAL